MTRLLLTIVGVVLVALVAYAVGSIVTSLTSGAVEGLT